MARGEGEGHKGGKKGEEITQRTSMNDPWTWTMVWGLTVGARGGGGLGGGEQRGKN